MKDTASEREVYLQNKIVSNTISYPRKQKHFLTQLTALTFTLRQNEGNLHSAIDKPDNLAIIET